MNTTTQRATVKAADRSHRVTTSQIGWRISHDLVANVKELATIRGCRPGQIVTEILREQLPVLLAPLSAEQVASKIHFPEYFPRR
jgi:hypothetical protein